MRCSSVLLSSVFSQANGSPQPAPAWVPSGNEAAADELDREVEIGGEFPGGAYEIFLDLDAVGVVFEYGGQARHDPKATAPLAKEGAGYDRRRRQSPQDAKTGCEVAGYEARAEPIGSVAPPGG